MASNVSLMRGSDEWRLKGSRSAISMTSSRAKPPPTDKRTVNRCRACDPSASIGCSSEGNNRRALRDKVGDKMAAAGAHDKNLQSDRIPQLLPTAHPVERDAIRLGKPNRRPDARSP